MTASEAAPPGSDPPQSRSRLSAIHLDGASIGRSNPNVEHEREVAIYDILDANSFAVVGRDDGRAGPPDAHDRQ